MLDHPWRATNYTANLGHCDRNVLWSGWFRLMYNGQNISMAQSCVPLDRCGTSVTLWMDGAHPGPQDGIVTRDVCKTNYQGCCSEKLPPIQVKACPGNFYVYKLYPPKACNSTFCAGKLYPTLTSMIVMIRIRFFCSYLFFRGSYSSFPHLCLYLLLFSLCNVQFSNIFLSFIFRRQHHTHRSQHNTNCKAHNNR